MRHAFCACERSVGFDLDGVGLAEGGDWDLSVEGVYFDLIDRGNYSRFGVEELL